MIARYRITHDEGSPRMAISFIGILALVIVVAVVVAVMNTTLKPSGDGKPRGFPWLLMLFGVVIMGGIATLIIRQSQPIHYVLHIHVPSGQEFLGEVTVDGQRTPIDGEGDGEFEFTGKSISWVVLVEDETGSELLESWMTIGANTSGMTTSYWGTTGVSEKQLMGNNTSFRTLNEDGWRLNMQRLRPDVGGSSILPGPSAASNPVDGSGRNESTPETEDAATLPTTSE